MSRKRDIEDRALSGLPVHGSDVVVVHRGNRSMTLRHAWRDDVDARIWSGVRTAFLSLAGELADKHRRPIDVYSREGFMLDQVLPSG